MYIFYSKLITAFISFILFIFNLFIFYPILSAKNLIFPYCLNPFDIVSEYPNAWNIIKNTYYFCSYACIFIIINSLISFKTIKSKKNNRIKKNNNIPPDNLKILVGYNSLNKEKIYIPEKGLYQNILITGTIGSRKNKFSNVSIP